VHTHQCWRWKSWRERRERFTGGTREKQENPIVLEGRGKRLEGLSLSKGVWQLVLGGGAFVWKRICPNAVISSQLLLVFLAFFLQA